MDRSAMRILSVNSCLGTSGSKFAWTYVRGFSQNEKFICLKSLHPSFPRQRTSGKASGRSRWVFASMATLPTPFAAYSNGPGLTELLRLYVCGLQPRPSVQLSSSRTSLTDNEYSPRKLALSAVERRESRSFVLAGFRLAPAVAGLAGMTTWLLLLVQPTELRPMRCD